MTSEPTDPTDALDPDADYDPASLLQADAALLGPWPDDEPLGDDDCPLGEPIVLDWSTTASLPEHGLTLPVVLDPTRPTSHWVGAPADCAQPVLVQLQTLTFRVSLCPEDGDTPQLCLGRDALRDRIAVAVRSP